MLWVCSRAANFPGSNTFRMLDVNQIQEILPHRFPMLMVDRVLEISEERIVAIKNVSINEAHFQGHYPGFPVMPGVLIVEAMAQTGAIMLLYHEEKGGDRIVLFAGIDNAKFRRPVYPGDQLRMEVNLVRRRGSIVKVDATATVDGQRVCEASLMCSWAERSALETPR